MRRAPAPAPVATIGLAVFSGMIASTCLVVVFVPSFDDLPTYGGLYPLEFEKRGRELKVRGEGQFVFNNIALRLKAALAGFGLAYLPEDQDAPRRRAAYPGAR